MTRRWRPSARLLIPLAVFALVVGGVFLFWAAKVTGPSEPQHALLRSVSFGVLPYADHTYVKIGLEQGWFKDVGINLEPRVIKVDQIVPFLKNGTLDVVSTPPAVLLASYENAPNLVHFVFGDLFQGYALMGPKTAKTFSELSAGGRSPTSAIEEVMSQVKGKVFAYPPEAAIKPFIELILQRGGLAQERFKAMVVDDPLTTNAMRAGQAQFQVGGVPSRLTLQKEGFRTILRAVDLARLAEPSPNSPELAGILQNGWATTLEFYRDHYDTILRLASVNYRIMQFIHDHPREAAAIHMPYLSSVTGETFTEQDAEIIYNDLDPFVPFDEQREWVHDPDSIFFYRNINGAILASFVKQGIYKGTPPDLDTVIRSADVYKELERLRAATNDTLQRIHRSGREMKVSKLVDESERQKSNFNFLDASNRADEAAKLLGLD
jgi:ABC-type nitrate/sulfonate/bicarbonate transport system substrate-binding protein